MKIQARVYTETENGTRLIWQHKKYLMLQHEKK
jgi:hypothetical protein